jgi:2-polyprenyl-3-methyl-5-hydroxy-6-metoxy-1,4-benzoquinol methylase
MDEEQFVTVLYKAIFLREPDPAGLSAHVGALKNGKSAEQTMSEFLQSPEFRSKNTGSTSRYPCDDAPPMRVDLNLTDEQYQALWARVAQAWADLGSSEPYWSVLTNPQWKASQMTQADVLNKFYETGRRSLGRFDKWLARSQVSLPATGTCAEYGCGVGRCTIWLAKRYARVVAFDISEPHLRLARVRAEAEGLNNIEFVHVTSECDLQRGGKIDLFYSVIVLQHNPPPLILLILKHAFERLKPGGVAFFQVPTYAMDYSFRLKEYLSRMAGHGMEMHFVPQRAIFDLSLAHGMEPLEVSPDGMAGDSGRRISTTFLMTKRNGGAVVA